MIGEAAQTLLDENKLGTLATVGSDARPRQSVVYYANEGERVHITTVLGRAKVADIERDEWASISVRGDEPPFPSATYSGRASIRTADIGPPTARVMQRIAGLDEPPESQSDDLLAEAGRVLIEIEVERVSGACHLD